MALLLGVPWLLPWGSTASDVHLYAAYAARMVAGEVPYVDIPIEYPPLAALLFYLPRLGVGHTAYVTTFILAMGAVELGWKRLLWRQLPGAAQRGALLLLCTLAGAALYYTYLKRYDMVAAAATAWVCAHTARRPASLAPWIVGALAVACKVYPVVLVPVLLLYGRHQGVTWGRQLQQLGAAALTALAVQGAALCLWGPASLRWWTYHQERGLHLASTYSAVALAWRGWGKPLPTEVAFGSWQVAAGWAHACAQAAPWVTVAALGVTWVAASRRCRTPADLWCAASASLIALLLCSKVFSPQYMIWLVPGVAMASVLSSRRPAGLPFDPWLAGGLVAACVLTAMTYPNEYRIAEGQVTKQVSLLLRDLALVGLWVRLGGWPPMLVFRRRHVSFMASEGLG